MLEYFWGNGYSLLDKKGILEAMEAEDIIIEDFVEDRLNGASYDATFGGKEGVYFSLTKKVMRRVKEDKIEKKKYLVLDPFETVVFWTKERIELSQRYAALILTSNLASTCFGISNISTTVDPGWKGSLAIQIRNTTPLRIELCDDLGICTLCFFKLSRKTDISVRHWISRYDIYHRLKAMCNSVGLAERLEILGTTIEESGLAEVMKTVRSGLTFLGKFLFH